MLGYKDGTLKTTYKDFLKTVHPDDRNAVIDAVNACTNEGTSYDIEHRIVWQDGTIRWMQGRGDVYRDESGKNIRMLGVIQDITDRKDADNLREDIERITRHDLKSPLTGIISLPQLLMTKENITVEQKELLKMIEEAGYNMLRMIDNSLSLYKMEKCTYQFEPKSIDLVPIIKKIIAEELRLIKAKRVLVSTLFNNNAVNPAKSFMVSGENLLCYTMLSNIIVNAIEASPEGGKVRISLIEKRAAMIEIHNKGTVPENIQKRFFEKYTTHGKHGGTGLGTYSAKLMVETQGGSIKMSTSEKSGTTITIHMPK